MRNKAFHYIRDPQFIFIMAHFKNRFIQDDGAKVRAELLHVQDSRGKISKREKKVRDGAFYYIFLGIYFEHRLCIYSDR